MEATRVVSTRDCSVWGIKTTWSLPTDSVELDALIAQVLGVHDDVILGLAVSDQYTNPLGVGTHPCALSEVVLENVVQSQTCSEDKVHFFLTTSDL